MKTCRACLKQKPLDSFSPHPSSLDCKNYKCKPCNAEAKKKWRLTNLDRVKAEERNFYHRHKQQRMKSAAEWREKNRDYWNAYQREWRKGKRLSTPYASNEHKRLVTPKWADRRRLKDVYRTARAMTLATGIRWEVDHIIPLTHPLVCGLHVETNVRVITRTANRSRGNRVSLEELV